METARYNGTRQQDRLCRFCSNGKVEDEVHLLFECPSYKEDSKKLYDSHPELCDTTTLPDKIEKLCNLPHSFGKLIVNMWNMRTKNIKKLLSIT